MPYSARELRSTITDGGKLTLSLEQAMIDEPSDDEVVVRIEATPINPSDLGLLLGPADISTLRALSNQSVPTLSFSIPEVRLPGARGRIGRSLSVGSEAAGTVVAAGRNAKAMEGRLVGVTGRGLYADYVKLDIQQVIALPEGATAADGASMFINPMTALGFIETTLAEGHKAIVHLAAASNLGQMLQKLCLADGIPLVNIVRSEEQAAILRGIGAAHVLISTDEDFRAQLTQAVADTGATIAFDPIGGGSLGGDVLAAMEKVAVGRMTEYNRYGSDVFKQLYIYGSLDRSPIVLDRMTFGFEWGVAGWLLFPFLKKASPQTVERMRQRVRDELTTIFASRYTRIIGLEEALQPDVLRAYEPKATGEKFLIDPTRG